uniref:Uncharacterized protein n=1 Tax=Panagrolaimus davidi TaxID=227884 RepID=A0A914QXR9_9BILA
MELSNEIKFEFVKDGKILSDVIIGCYGEEYKDVEDSLSCIFRLLSTLPEPLRTEFALSGAHDAIQHNIDRLPTINSIDGYSTDKINNIMIRYMEDC